jgi:hypothetical protein
VETVAIGRASFILDARLEAAHDAIEGRESEQPSARRAGRNGLFA